MGRKACAPQYQALYGDIFSYQRFRDHLGLDDGDILEQVARLKPGTLVITEDYRRRHAKLQEGIKSVPQMARLAATISGPRFMDSHRIAKTEWTHIWSLLLQKSKFHTRFTEHLRSLQLDPTMLLYQWETEKHETTADKPTPGMLLTPEKDAIVEWLFGVDGFVNQRATVVAKEDLQTFAMTLYRLVWDKDSRKVPKLIQDLESTMDTVKHIWSTWMDTSILKQSVEVTAWLQLLSKGKKLAGSLGADQAFDTIEDHHKNIVAVLQTKNASVLEAHMITRLSRRERDYLAGMIKPDEIQKINILWGASLEHISDEEAVDSTVGSSDHQIQMQELFPNETMGVDREVSMSSKELYHSLGGAAKEEFCGLPNMNYAAPKNGWYSYCTTRSTNSNRGDQNQDGFDAQNNANNERIKGQEISNPEFTVFELRWHQLGGIHSILHHISTPTQPYDGESTSSKRQPVIGHSRSGILLADEVGVGKTGQALGTLGQVIHWTDLSKDGKPLPPVHRNAGGTSQTVFGSTKLPEGPHIIVTPPQLFLFWVDQLRHILGWNVDVIPYEGTYKKRTDFFAKNGLFEMSQRPLHRRIILCSSTALASDASALLDYTKRAKGKPRGVATPLKATAMNPNAKRSIFSRSDYGMLIVDEVHLHRTGGASYDGLLQLRDKSLFVLAMTATPLFTSTRDLRNIGRILNIQSFLTEEADKQEGKALRAMNKVRKLQNSLKMQRGEAVDEIEGALKDRVAEILEDVMDVRHQYRSRIIRRTLKSPGENGEGTVTGLKDFWEIRALLPLTASERTKLEEIDGVVGNRLEHGTNVKDAVVHVPSGFYIHLRQGSINPSVVHATVHDEDLPLLYESKVDCDNRCSSKEREMIHIVLHHAQFENRQSNPLSWDGDGGPKTTLKPPDLPLGSTDQIITKFVIYSEFVGLFPYIQSALDAYEVSYLTLTGQKDIKTRHEIIEQFRTGKTQVLLLSNVGRVGINLSVANILIVLDAMWANTDFRQVIGRLWRPPQALQVIAYRLIALGTADETLLDIAENKETLFNAFNSHDKGTIKGILKGIMGVNEDTTDASELEDHDEHSGTQDSSGGDKHGQKKGRLGKDSEKPTQGGNLKKRDKRGKPSVANQAEHLGLVVSIAGKRKKSSVTSDEGGAEEDMTRVPKRPRKNSAPKSAEELDLSPPTAQVMGIRSSEDTTAEPLENNTMAIHSPTEPSVVSRAPPRGSDANDTEYTAISHDEGDSNGMDFNFDDGFNSSAPAETPCIQSSCPPSPLGSCNSISGIHDVEEQDEHIPQTESSVIESLPDPQPSVLPEPQPREIIKRPLMFGPKRESSNSTASNHSLSSSTPMIDRSSPLNHYLKIKESTHRRQSEYHSESETDDDIDTARLDGVNRGYNSMGMEPRMTLPSRPRPFIQKPLSGPFRPLQESGPQAFPSIREGRFHSLNTLQAQASKFKVRRDEARQRLTNRMHPSSGPHSPDTEDESKEVKRGKKISHVLVKKQPPQTSEPLSSQEGNIKD